MSETPHADDPCTPADCGATSGRRDFLKDGLLALAALTALGATADRLGAMSRVYATGSVDGTAVRYPMPTADGATIDKPNKLILARFEGAVFAFALECPHRGENVTWQAKEGRFFCPKHKSTFKPAGDLIQGKAERGLDRYPVTRDGDEVVVDTSRTIRSTDEAAWGAAKVAA